VFPRHLIGVKRPLRFIEYEHVFWRDEVGSPRIRGHIRLDVSDERLASSARTPQFVLQDLDEGTVAREVDGRCAWLAIDSFDGEVI
jgi:hypothetical protein